MKISVIIPLYNKEHYIERTLQSVLTQTYQDWEVIIIDDGSTDNSANIVLTTIDPRIKFFQQANCGVSATRNRAIKLATGDFVAFLDADDEWMDDYLDKMVELSLSYPNYFVFCSAQKDRPIHTLPEGVSIINDHCLYDYIYFTGCMFIKKEVFDKVGGFREGIQLGEDRDMWLRIGCYYPTVYLNEEHVNHPYNTENNLSHTINITKSFPYWEWYKYPYPNRKSLYKYTTNQIVICVTDLVKQHRYSDAWSFLRKTRGINALRPRIKLLYKIIFQK